MEIQTQAIGPCESHSWSNGIATIVKVSTLLRVGLWLWCLLVVACGGGKSPTAPSGGTGNTGISPTLTAVRVSGDNGAKVGDTVQLTAEAVYSDGSTTMVTTQATWSSGTPTVASVSSSGMVTALSVGTTSIQASFQGRAGTRTVEVRKAAEGPTPKEIRVRRADCPNPCAPTHPGDQVQMRAEAVFSDGSTTEVTARSAWSSDSPADAGVDSNGLVTTINPYKVVGISAQFEEVTGRYPLVTAPHSVSAALEIERFECLGDCEDFTQGAGDFTYSVSLLQRGSWFDDVVSETSLVRLRAGESRPIDDRVGVLLNDDPQEEFHIKFCATEWDLGDVPDSNMNDRCSSAVYRWSTGRWVPEQVNYITLGSGSCRVRLHYRLKDVTYTKPR